MHTFDCIDCYIFHFRDHLPPEIILFIIETREVVLKLRVRYFVSSLISSVISKSLLNSIVGQMYFWTEDVDVEGVRRCSDVALFVPIASHYPVQICY